MIKKILTQRDEFNTLHEPCVHVAVFDKELRDLVADMWDSMYAANGVGLAATQIGGHLRVAVVDTLRTENSKRRLVLVNPCITETGGEELQEEGCLSMPGLHWPIPRAAVVVVTFQSLEGKTGTLRAKGLLSRAIQHECDHLDGILCNSRAVSQETQ